MLREPQVGAFQKGGSLGRVVDRSQRWPLGSLLTHRETKRKRRGAGGGEERMRRGLWPWGGRQGPP